MCNIFEPVIKEETIVYKKQSGEVIDILDGFVRINGKCYENDLPIEYKHVRTTIQVETLCTIEKQKK